jgi:hypothetical protein
MLDPTSTSYYKELEMKVATRFPEKWGPFQKEIKAPAPRMTSSETATASTAFGRALRISIKEALHSSNDHSAPAWTTSRPESEPVVILHGFMNPNFQSFQNIPAHKSSSLPEKASTAAIKSVSPVRLRANPKAVPSTQMQEKGSRDILPVTCTAGIKPAPQQLKSSTLASSPDSVLPLSAATRSSLSRDHIPSAASVSEVMVSASTPSSTKSSSVGPGQRAAKSTSKVTILKQLRRAVTEQPSAELFSPVSYEEMQAEYLRQRALVVEELKRAKEQAEIEKARIMAKIGKALNTSRWRS